MLCIIKSVSALSKMSINANLCENFVRHFSFLFWNDTEYKLDQVSHILEAEGAEMKLVFNSTLWKYQSMICKQKT